MTSRRKSLRSICLATCLAAVGCLGDPVEDLIVQLDDTNADIRLSAIKSLQNLEGERVDAALAKAVDDSDPEIRRSALMALGSRGPGAAAYLSRISPALDDAEFSVRVDAALAIQKIEPTEKRSQEVLIEALLDGVGGVFLDVAELGSDAKWAVPTLQKLLRHRETKIRHLAAHTLGQLGPTAANAESALKEVSKYDPEEAVRQRATEAMEAISASPTE